MKSGITYFLVSIQLQEQGIFRRIFINENGSSTSPSTLAALNPVIYLPMTEDYAIGKNLGTGGDFTATGSPVFTNSGTDFLSDYGEGGLVWIKNMDQADDHVLTDTVRGATKITRSNSKTDETTDADTLTAFNSAGFSVGADVKVNTKGLVTNIGGCGTETLKMAIIT